MPVRNLRLFDLPLAPGEAWGPVALGNAMLYCASGAATVGGAALAANAAQFLRGEAAATAGADGARLLLFELAPEGPAPLAPPLLTQTLALADGEWLMRCDRVDFPPGGIAYLHTHQGPGIRCLVGGGLGVETGGATRQIAPFEAWFEAGPEPVLARASAHEASAFVRAMVLPRGLLGKSSIRYVRPEDRDKPKPQRYTVFQDVPIEL